MKKLFASLMAATMVAGMSVSAFAYTDKAGENPMDEKVVAIPATLYSEYEKDIDDDFAFGKVILKKAPDAKTVYGGDKLYAPILVNVEEVEDDDAPAGLVSGYYYATKASEVKDLKVSYKETEGKGAIKKAEIVKDDADKFGLDKKLGKVYGIKITLNDYFKTEEKDMEFDLTLKEKGKEMLKVEDIYFNLGQDDGASVKKGEAAVAKDTTDNKMKPYFIKDGKKDFTGIQKDGEVWKIGTDEIVDKDGKVTTKGSEAGIVLAKNVDDGYGFGYDAKFKKSSQRLELTVGADTKAVTLDEVDKAYFGLGKDDNEEIKELYMETADGEMIVEGKLSEQDPLFLGFETDPTDFQKAVMVENSKADVDTFNWVARPTFDFLMDVRVPVEDDRDNFLYEEIDGKLVEVEAKLNDDGDELVFEAKTLGKYLLSDKELSAEKAEEEAKGEEAKEEATEKEDSKKENAETGASLVAVATAIALF